VFQQTPENNNVLQQIFPNINHWIEELDGPDCSDLPLSLF
jgi:hypothetical protein